MFCVWALMRFRNIWMLVFSPLTRPINVNSTLIDKLLTHVDSRQSKSHDWPNILTSVMKITWLWVVFKITWVSVQKFDRWTPSSKSYENSQQPANIMVKNTKEAKKCPSCHRDIGVAASDDQNERSPLVVRVPINVCECTNSVPTTRGGLKSKGCVFSGTLSSRPTN